MVMQTKDFNYIIFSRQKTNAENDNIYFDSFNINLVYLKYR